MTAKKGQSAVHRRATLTVILEAQQMAIRSFLAASLAALSLGVVGTACAMPSSRDAPAMVGTYNPLMAPGAASGSAAAHIDGVDGTGPIVHRPAPRPGEGTRDADSAALVGGGAGGPQKLHLGEGSGNAGWPGGARFGGSSGDGPILLRAPTQGG